MGFGKHKQRIRAAIRDWGCQGYLGYGHGRTLAQYDEKLLRGKSVCLDLCTKMDSCRRMHHQRMDARYPHLSQIVGNALKVSSLHKTDPVSEIVGAMERSVELDLDEALEVKRVTEQFGVKGITDHYRAGQFENIQNGLDKVEPRYRRPIPEEAKKAS